MGKRDTLKHEERIQGVFRRAWVDHGWSAATDITPLDHVMAEEFDADEFDGEAPEGTHYWPHTNRRDVELTALKREEAAEVAAWAREQLVRWIIGDGLHPFHIVQRVYALLFARYQPFIGPLNMTWMAKILNQGRAAFSAVMKRLFTRPVKIKSGVMMLSPGMKSEASREAYAQNAARNVPRRELDASSLDHDAEASAEKQSQEERRQKLKTARDWAERKRIAALVGCKPEEIDLNKSNPHDDDHDNE